MYKTSTDVILANQHGMLYPLLLVMANCSKSENYEFDPGKVELHLRRRKER